MDNEMIKIAMNIKVHRMVRTQKDYEEFEIRETDNKMANENL